MRNGLFLWILPILSGGLNGGTSFLTVEVLENCGDNLFVLSISALGHIRLHHGFELHRCVFGLTAPAGDC
jgi:hypothetical protein